MVKVKRSSSDRRIKRHIKKVTPEEFATRVREWLPNMSRQEELWLPYLDYHEQMLFDILRDMGVPEDEWEYYTGAGKRMLSIYMRFSGQTAVDEVGIIKEEYRLRGLSVSVLNKEDTDTKNYVDTTPPPFENAIIYLEQILIAEEFEVKVQPPLELLELIKVLEAIRVMQPVGLEDAGATESIKPTESIIFTQP